MTTILLIDDDIDVLKINKKYLDNEGFQTLTAATAIDGIRLIEQYHPDCIVLDVMMPQVNGFQACSKIRTLTDAPVIFLTGRTSEDDKIKGLMLGADDYIIKPYSLKELHARILARIRRNQAPTYVPSTILSIPPLKIDKTTHKVYYEEEELTLSKKEYDLLLYLASNPNTVITFEDIATTLWGSYHENDRRTIMVQMSRLRKKLGYYNELENMIETVWSKGYKFIAT